jgi:hypothetical protein
MMQGMGLMEKIRAMLRRESPSPEGLEAQRHAADEVLDKRLSQRGMAVQNHPPIATGQREVIGRVLFA